VRSAIPFRSGNYTNSSANDKTVSLLINNEETWESG